MKVSVIFETISILPKGAPLDWNLPYLNLVVSGKTVESPHSLLQILKKIEVDLGRDPHGERWAPRVIDLDILSWEDCLIHDDQLTIPHQELFNRPFLLHLIASICPNWRYFGNIQPYHGLMLSEIIHRWFKQDLRTLQYFVPTPLMVGIVNITPDSFSDGGKYLHIDQAIAKVHDFVKQGAAVIDLGAQSTRPLALMLTADEEWERLEPVLAAVMKDFSHLVTKPKISIDSCRFEVIAKAIKYPIDWVNDVQGGQDPKMLDVICETNCHIVLNHSLGVPPQEEVVIPFDRDPIEYLIDWAYRKIEQFEARGVSRDRIIIDPGIGFGKTAWQSFDLLKKIARLKECGCDLLVGHSRKSFLKSISHASPNERDDETIGVSHVLSELKVDYLRVHNIASHHKSLSAALAVRGGYDY